MGYCPATDLGHGEKMPVQSVPVVTWEAWARLEDVAVLSGKKV